MENKKSFGELAGLLLALAGSAIITISFFMPWVKVKLVVKSMHLSGLTLSQDSMALWAVPGLAILIGILSLIGLAARKAKPQRLLLTILSIVGVVLMGMIFISIKGEMSSGIKKAIAYQFQTGIWTTLSGFILGMFGGFIMKSSR